ncbi:hypothetical protein J2S59_002578 [Nocardioides massiliensis]|uniref:Uncharacterized protein n=1 Tax=Nocardioides massiliensis TaxID=1325935 RepID=A0ABT9NQR5_9ACTN|nr:hypothetical protein [Nocardioides massiliensis]
MTTYELADPWPYAHLSAHSGRHESVDVYARAVIEYANDDEHWRVQQALTCTCRSRRTIAEMVVHVPSARLWVSMKPERIPSAFRKAPSIAEAAYPLHGVAGEAPHVHGIASCKASGCGKRWLVVSFTDRAELLRIADATHGAKIVD